MAAVRRESKQLPSPTTILYQSPPPDPAAAAFVAVTSTVLVSSPLWGPLILAWAGYRASASSKDAPGLLELLALLRSRKGGRDDVTGSSGTPNTSAARIDNKHFSDSTSNSSSTRISTTDTGAESTLAAPLPSGRLGTLRAWAASTTHLLGLGTGERRSEAAALRKRRWGLLVLLTLLAFWPVKRWRAFHSSKRWERTWFAHLGVSAVGPVDHPRLAKAEQLLYAVVPHGIFPFGLGFACLGPLRDHVFRISRVVVASATTKVPLLRHVLGWIGCVEATPDSVHAALARGETLALAPGGIQEMFWGFPRPGCLPHEEYALLLPRKGFVRMALQHGLPLVPVYVFGNTKLLKRVQLPHWLERLSLLLRASLVLFWGRGGFPVPFQVPLLYAIGEPLTSHLLRTVGGEGGRRRKVVYERLLAPGNAPRAATDVSCGSRRYTGGGGSSSLLPSLLPSLSYSPSAHEVDALHAEFCASLVALFDQHKHRYGWGHKVLRVV